MKIKQSFAIFILFISGFILGCSAPDSTQKDRPITKQDLPEHIQKLDNLTVYDANTQVPDTVEFVRETVFESNEEVFFDGYIWEVHVDDNTVYIVATSPGSGGIYAFSPDGSYITSITKSGRGPGEYESIGSIQIQNNKLWVFDPRLQKIGSFSLKDYSHIKDHLINRDEIKNVDTLAYRLKGNKLFVLSNGDHLLKLRHTSLEKESDIAKVLYYKISNDGIINPGPVLKLDRFPTYFPQKSDNKAFPFPITMPFTRSSLVSITSTGEFFTAWTEDFLIKKYDEKGNYLRAFYYPMENSTLFLDELDIGRFRQKILDNYELPDTWPVMHTMEMDDEGRLWILTITKSDTTYKGWVLDDKGKLLAKFNWPGERASRFVKSKPLMVIKNGYLYTHERNMKAGIERIIKHKINFKSLAHNNNIN